MEGVVPADVNLKTPEGSEALEHFEQESEEEDDILNNCDDADETTTMTTVVKTTTPPRAPLSALTHEEVMQVIMQGKTNEQIRFMTKYMDYVNKVSNEKQAEYLAEWLSWPCEQRIVFNTFGGGIYWCDFAKLWISVRAYNDVNCLALYQSLVKLAAEPWIPPTWKPDFLHAAETLANSEKGEPMLRLLMKRPSMRNDKFGLRLNKVAHLFPLRDKKVVDLKSGTVRDVEKDDFFSVTGTRSYRPELLPDPDVEAFWSPICDDDPETIECIQRLLGYSITAEGFVKYWNMVFFEGPTDSAKTTVTRILQTVLDVHGGSLCSALPWRTLSSSGASSPANGDNRKGDTQGLGGAVSTKRKRTPKQTFTTSHDASLEVLEFLRLAMIPEVPKGARWEEHLYKALLSDDELLIRSCYGKGYRPMQCRAKFWGMMNDLTDQAAECWLGEDAPLEMKNRTKVFFTPARFIEKDDIRITQGSLLASTETPEEKLRRRVYAKEWYRARDTELVNRLLYDETKKDAFFSWIVQGAMKWYQHGKKIDWPEWQTKRLKHVLSTPKPSLSLVKTVESLTPTSLNSGRNSEKPNKRGRKSGMHAANNNNNNNNNNPNGLNENLEQKGKLPNKKVVKIDEYLVEYVEKFFDATSDTKCKIEKQAFFDGLRGYIEECQKNNIRISTPCSLRSYIYQAGSYLRDKNVCTKGSNGSQYYKGLRLKTPYTVLPTPSTTERISDLWISSGNSVRRRKKAEASISINPQPLQPSSTSAPPATKRRKKQPTCPITNPTPCLKQEDSSNTGSPPTNLSSSNLPFLAPPTTRHQPRRLILADE